MSRHVIVQNGPKMVVMVNEYEKKIGEAYHIARIHERRSNRIVSKLHP